MSLRLGLILAAVGAFLALGLAWKLERDEAARQRARADAAALQSGVDTSTAAIADKVASDRVVIIQQTEEKARAVEAIPSDDVPADVLAGWRAGLRYGSGVGSNPDSAAELPGAVQGAEP